MKGIAMNTVRSILPCAAALAVLLGACSASGTTQPTVMTTPAAVPEAQFGVVESIQMVQVMPPPAASSDIAGTPPPPAHSTYQIGVRLNQGGYQVFTQDEAGNLRVGEQVRIDHGIVRPA